MTPDTTRETTPKIQELRYVRRRVADLDAACGFAVDAFGLMPQERTETEAMLRSDRRHYSLCLSTALDAAVGLSVPREADLDAFAERLGAAAAPIDGEDAERRRVKRGLSVAAPNGLRLELVWRHMECGWPYHGPRDTGLDDFASVQLASTRIGDDAAFWRDTLGLSVSDYAGEARFMALQGDGAHHRIALYPSQRDGLMGAAWRVGSVDYVMRHWHFLQKRQAPIIHGPGRQPTSGASFVTTQAPDGLLMSYATEMDAPPSAGPRQFADEPGSHCSWGSPTERAEFLGAAQ